MRRAVVCLLIASSWSVSFLVHFFQFLERGNRFRLTSYLMLWVLLSIMLWFLGKYVAPVINAAWQKRSWMLTAAVGSALFLIFFMQYQRLPEFTTTHQLEIENPPGSDWKDVEILGVRRADFSEFPENVRIVKGSVWQGESSILLGGGGKLNIQDVFRGGVEIRLRAGPNAGKAVITWDGREQFVDLYSPEFQIFTVNLDGFSWGTLSGLRFLLVNTARIADFLSFFSLMMIMITFFIAAYLQTGRKSKREEKLNLVWLDGIVFTSFMLLAVILTCNQAAGSFSQYTSLSGDAGNYASFAAALRFPELFVRDPLLSDPGRFGFYATFHIPFMNLVYPLFGNFGSAFFVLELPTIFLQLTGFYLLGRYIYRSRLFGLLLTGLCFIFFQINLSEFWGFVASPIARFSFQAVLPFVMIFALNKGCNPRWWPLLMAVTGSLVYVHAVSAPAWSAAIALALWFMPGTSVPAKKKIGWAALSVIIFIMVLIPFSFDYFGNTQFGEVDGQNLNQVQNIIRYRQAEGIIDISSAIDGFFRTAIASHWVNTALFTLAYVSLAGMLWMQYRKGEEYYALRIVCFLGGIISVSILFPMLDFRIAEMLNRNPLQIQFLRTLRNYLPLIFISILLPLAYAYARYSSKWYVKTAVFCSGLLIFLSWAWRAEFAKLPVIEKTMDCWQNGFLICPDPQDDLRAEFFEAVRTYTPEGSSILAEDLAIRYYSLRPLAFIKKDGATFAFSDHASLLKWYPQSLRYDDIARLREDKAAFAKAYWQFGVDLGADYVMLDTDGYNAMETDFSNDSLIFQNPLYSLIAVR